MNMKKGLLAVLVVVICASATLSGCQDTSSIKTQKKPLNVSLDSTIVEFANVSFEKNINKSGGIESVTVGWLFHNIAGKLISAKIDVKFFDKNNISRQLFHHETALGQHCYCKNKAVHLG